jgi:hypothetical protein
MAGALASVAAQEKAADAKNISLGKVNTTNLGIALQSLAYN